MKFNIFRALLDFALANDLIEPPRKQDQLPASEAKPAQAASEPEAGPAPQLVRQPCEHDILALLERMVELLKVSYLNDWAAALEQCGEAVRVNPLAGTSSVLSKFSGANSLDDVRLFKAGSLLTHSDKEFAALRAELYTLCHLFNKQRLGAERAATAA